MIRISIIITLAATLITLAILEQHLIQGSYRELERRTDALVASIGQLGEDEKVDTDENKKMIDELYNFWVRRERHLTMLARHFDLAQVSLQIIYVRNFIYFDNKEEAYVGVLNMQYLIKTHSFNVGTSVQNVI
ncbi:MAG: DUF4363 family protein [Firmicutes bacterium]|nr:DUF4363 family protein [Bacillota bacterium]